MTQQNFDFFVSLIASKIDPIGEAVWRAVVSSYEDAGLHKVQAYSMAQSVRDQAVKDAALKMAWSCGGDDGHMSTSVARKIAQEAVSRIIK